MLKTAHLAFLALFFVSPAAAIGPETQTGPPSEATFLGTPFTAQDQTLSAWLRDTWRQGKRLLRDKPEPTVPDSVARRYARNVWDMQLWQGKIYLGHGNSSNHEPFPNAGPVSVVYYDPATAQFATEFVVDEEQIDRFVVIGDRLHIPGHDPREPWDLGNFYRLTGSGWEKRRTIPHSIHAYDLLSFRDTLFAAGSSRQGAQIWRSADAGQTWDDFVLPATPRAYTLFTLDGRLHVSAYRKMLFRYTGDGFTRVDADLFPDAHHGPHPLVVRPTHLNGTLLYIGAERTNDHQWIPFAAYTASRLDDIRRVDLPETHLPYDLLVRDNRAFLLANRQVPGKTETAVVIYASDDLKNWTEVVRCPMPTFARSFEYHQGAFYLGLGIDARTLHPASGHLYRVVPPGRRQHTGSPPD